MTGVFDRGCERAQAWASLELDGELSQIERALLATHVRGCAACAETVAGVRTLTHAPRNAPLEPRATAARGRAGGREPPPGPPPSGPPRAGRSPGRWPPSRPLGPGERARWPF